MSLHLNHCYGLLPLLLPGTSLLHNSLDLCFPCWFLTGNCRFSDTHPSYGFLNLWIHTGRFHRFLSFPRMSHPSSTHFLRKCICLRLLLLRIFRFLHHLFFRYSYHLPRQFRKWLLSHMLLILRSSRCYLQLSLHRKLFLCILPCNTYCHLLYHLIVLQEGYIHLPSSGCNLSHSGHCRYPVLLRLPDTL